jgi:hypothetical protein
MISSLNLQSSHQSRETDKNQVFLQLSTVTANDSGVSYCPQALWSACSVIPDTILPAEVLITSRGAQVHQACPGLSEHSGRVGCSQHHQGAPRSLVKWTQEQQESNPRDQQGILRNHYRSFPGSQLRVVFQSINFTTPSTKLLDVIHSYKYLLLKYRNHLHFENEMFWKWFFTFQVPGNGITVNWIIVVRYLSLEQEWSSCHRRINSP